MHDIDSSIYRTVDLEKFLSIIEDISLIEYFIEVKYLTKERDRFLHGGILKVRDKFHYLHYIDSGIRNCANHYIESIIIKNPFNPLELDGEVREYLKLHNSQLKVLLLEIRDDYLTILINKRVLIINKVDYLYGVILEQYNLNLIDND